jgi:hypothetical protein
MPLPYFSSIGYSSRSLQGKLIESDEEKIEAILATEDLIDTMLSTKNIKTRPSNLKGKQKESSLTIRK